MTYCIIELILCLIFVHFQIKKVFTKVFKNYLNTSMYLVFKYICKKYLVFKYILSLNLVFSI